MRIRFTAATLSLTILAAPLYAQTRPAFNAQPTINPQAFVYPTGVFGSLPANSFGGSGISTNAVMTGGVGGVVLGLSATPRYTSPSLTNDGAGTFFATPGYSTGGPVNAPNAAWNFDFFIGGSTAGDYTYSLYYDFDPSSDRRISHHGHVDFGGANADSWNLAMGFLSLTIPGLITPPPYAPFDANNTGEYTFALVQYDRTGEVDRVGMAVQVDAAVTATPEPALLALMTTGLLGVGVSVRRRKRA